jgi:hypothetical protein
MAEFVIGICLGLAVGVWVGALLEYLDITRQPDEPSVWRWAGRERRNRT